MTYWQYKFSSWAGWKTIQVNETIRWKTNKTINKEPNTISVDDIVFLFRSGNISQKNKGIYFVAKVIDIDFKSEYPINLKILKDLRENIFYAEQNGFEKVVKKINTLQMSGRYYKFKNDDNPKKMYQLIMENENSSESIQGNLDIYPDEVDSYFIEGAKTKVFVNKFERNQKARKLCLEHYGYNCQTCHFNFEKMYGEIGKDSIHVHHIIPISKIRKNYQVDPIKDLIPVCPNCHLILHKKNAPTVDQLKTKLK